MSKDFTPGPWFAYKRPEPVGYAEYEIHYGTSGECVAEVVHGEGNARLLAAAPDLLDALKLLLREEEAGTVCNIDRATAYAAIAAAEGK